MSRERPQEQIPSLQLEKSLVGNLSDPFSIKEHQVMSSGTESMQYYSNLST